MKKDSNYLSILGKSPLFKGIRDDEIEEMKQLVHSAMVGVMTLKIPLIVDMNVGKNWKEC